mgnify:CR=1 FL=1
MTNTFKVLNDRNLTIFSNVTNKAFATTRNDKIDRVSLFQQLLNNRATSIRNNSNNIFIYTMLFKHLV